jgi:16S rRNA (cytidine1402-2'-O)-methyltransferase
MPLVNTSHTLLIQQAAASAAGAQQHPTGALYVVATPIGNLADLTLRAIHVLTVVDAIACEDTRHSGPFLRQLGIDATPLHEHNEREAAHAVLARLAQGQRVAYVSDAGSPAISDPGAALVAAVQAAGYRTLPIPGPSSAVAALSVAGDVACKNFVFTGFLPTRSGERARALQHVVADERTQIIFEAPHRIHALALALHEACEGAEDRRVTLCRELTKQFETVITLPVVELPHWLSADANRLRGEFVLVLHARTQSVTTLQAPAFEKTLQTLMLTLPLKQAVALAAELTGSSRNAVYEHALVLKRDQSTVTDIDS